MSRLETLIAHFAKMIDPQHLVANEYGFQDGVKFYKVEILTENLPNSDTLFFVCREFWDFKFINVKANPKKITFVFEDGKEVGDET